LTAGSGAKALPASRADRVGNDTIDSALVARPVVALARRTTSTQKVGSKSRGGDLVDGSTAHAQDKSHQPRLSEA
jgi:hypothetical protein